ncbi:MAG: TatD DNase family protein [Candidatus Paceibacteria bacterium]
MITDTHSHIFWNNFDEDRAAVIERAREAGVDRMLVVGTDLETSRSCFSLCEGQPGLYPTAGIHPHDAEGVSDETLAAIRELCGRPECVAVGESGLDYFKEYSPREDQQRMFRQHLRWAVELDKPIIVHSREAHEDTLRLIGEFPGVRGVMHCYTMGTLELGPYLDLGFYISFSGVVTFPKNSANREAAREVPSNRLLVETDCPFLAPQGNRGKRNEPALVVEVLRCVAETRSLDIGELATITSDNATRLFGLA